MCVQRAPWNRIKAGMREESSPYPETIRGFRKGDSVQKSEFSLLLSPHGLKSFSVFGGLLQIDSFEIVSYHDLGPPAVVVLV